MRGDAFKRICGNESNSKILWTSRRSKMTTKTLYDKIVDLHTIEKLSEDGIERLVYVDRTVVN